MLTSDLKARNRLHPIATLLVATAVVATTLLAVFAGATGSARAAAQSTTCPTDAYTGSTIASCDTTTTVAGGQISVTVTYSNGVLKWQACGFPPSATGTSVQLYLDSVPVQLSGGTASVGAGGCAGYSASNQSAGVVATCLQPGTHNATAVDSAADAQGSATFSVSSGGVGCPGGNSGHSGSLAFTGGDFFKLLLAAFAAIVLGFLVVRVNRQRRRTR